jgi:hypothetical protein
MRDTKISWSDIDIKRNNLLSKSDWTQLPDSGLSLNCVAEWQIWRKKIRAISKDLYESPLPAVVDLKELQATHPTNEYKSDTSSFERVKATIARVDIRELVSEELEKYNISNPTHVVEEKPVVKPVEVDKPKTIDDIVVLGEAKKYAKGMLESEYRGKILKASPPLELTYLYSERLSQAIDYLSNNGTEFPLLEILAESLSKPLEEVATSILKKQASTINSFATIERTYIECLKSVNKAVTIPEIKEALEKFNGH